ncbi:MAG: sensor histidine kinase [Lachnospiraceae bacterium]|nr:sensor histidine kinase [Lachnospiraceae bacterium]
MTEFLNAVLSALIIIPAGLLSLAPMKKHLKYSPKRTVLYMLIIDCVLIPADAFVKIRSSLSPSITFMIMLLILFIAFVSFTTTGLCKSVSVYMFVCVIVSVCVNLSNAVDATANPSLGASFETIEFGISCTLMETAAALLLFYPMYRYGSFLIDNLNSSNIWNSTSVISGLFLFLNIKLMPVKYETLYVNRVFQLYIIIQVVVFVMEILMGAVFYNVSAEIISAAALKVRNHVLELVEADYEKQQKYIESTARIRHDFKHTIRTLEVMAGEADIDGIRAYLKEYSDTEFNEHVTNYCMNSALNATLNYYANEAVAAGITFTCRIELPSAESMPLTDIELCNITGNILENAVRSASAVQDTDKYIKLTITPEHDGKLYIVAVNSFNGLVRRKGAKYLSTVNKGSGIGLSSITAVAELHGGIASFDNSENEFYSDVMVPLVSPSSTSGTVA